MIREADSNTQEHPNLHILGAFVMYSGHSVGLIVHNDPSSLLLSCFSLPHRLHFIAYERFMRGLHSLIEYFLQVSTSHGYPGQEVGFGRLTSVSKTWTPFFALYHHVLTADFDNISLASAGRFAMHVATR